MKYNRYPKRDAIKNYFPLPNELFILCLNAGEISIYSYLLYLENRKTFQCWPSYKTIGKAVDMSQNTVRKYVLSLEDKALITTEPTTVYTKSGMKRNGSLLYTIRPIQEALDLFYARQMTRTRMWRSSARWWPSWPRSPLLFPVSRCVGLWSQGQEQIPTGTIQAELRPFRERNQGR